MKDINGDNIIRNYEVKVCPACKSYMHRYSPNDICIKCRKMFLMSLSVDYVKLNWRVKILLWKD